MRIEATNELVAYVTLNYGVRVVVDFSDDWQWPDCLARYQTKTKTVEITIGLWTTPAYFAQYLFHEVAHAVRDEAGVYNEDMRADEEDQCDQLGDMMKLEWKQFKLKRDFEVSV